MACVLPAAHHDLVVRSQRAPRQARRRFLKQVLAVRRPSAPIAGQA
jgi:hypothetical protein